jgi:glutamate dehydrogenase (NAD(P)+)
VLEERGVLIVPDILCNAGGVFVSYLEYTQETQQEQMSETTVQMRLQERMNHRFEAVYAATRAEGISMRDAAMYMGVKRACEAVVARGALP